MEHLYAFATALFSIPAVITLFSALLIGLLLGLRRSSHEQAVVFSITWPEQIKADWRGQELLDPSIRVRSSLVLSPHSCRLYAPLPFLQTSLLYIKFTLYRHFRIS